MKTYDIRNAGPKNRFTANGKIVSNSGRLAQPQNFPRISDSFEEFLDLARELVKAGDLETLEWLFGDEIPNVLSQLLRTTFIPDEDKEFLVLDFSAIEAVALSYIADENWRLEVFDSGGDIYKATASAMFKTPIDLVTKDQRQKGKVMELLGGFGGTKPAIQKMNETILDPKKRIPEKEMNPMVKAWRAANPNIVQLWWDTGKAAIQAVKTRQRVDLVKDIWFEMKNKNLLMHMPAGGSITYPDAHLRTYWIATVMKAGQDDEGNYIVEPTKIKLAEVKLGTQTEFYNLMNQKGLKQVENVDPSQRESLCFWGPNPTTKRWEIMETYGPRIVENFTQRFARDCLMFAVINFENKGVPVNLTVHDELVGEPLKGFINFEDAKDIMTITPPWAKGLNLRADGFIGSYYKK